MPNTTALTLLALAPQDWRAQWVNRQQLFSRIGRDNTVLYSSGGWFLWDRTSAEWRRSPWLGRIERTDNVWLDDSPRWMMRWPRVPALDRAVVHAQVRRWRRWLDVHRGRRRIAQICHPQYFPYVDLVGLECLVYHVYDQYDLMPDWTPELENAERELLRRADLVFCASQMMADALARKVPRAIEVLENGADVDAFAAAADAGSEPADLAAIPRPRIGWTGSLHPQIDFGLVAELAGRRPEWSFVFVGNKVEYKETRAEDEYRRCRERKNVHFLGYKQHGEVPAYVAGMDVNMMCYRLSDQTWIKVGSPLKLYEYLASGRPVVSANLPTVRGLTDVLQIAEGADEWAACIDDALRNGGRGSKERRRAVAAENSWDKRAETLSAWLRAIAADAGRVALARC